MYTNTPQKMLAISTKLNGGWTRHVPSLLLLLFLLQSLAFGDASTVPANTPLWTTNSDNLPIVFSTSDMTVLVNESLPFNILVKANVIKTPTNLTLQVDHVGHIVIHPETVQLKPNQQDDEYTIDVVGVNRGHFEISAIASPASAIDVSRLFVRVIVAYSYFYIQLSSIVGWVYFVAWTISFYPQMISNFRRKSVVGLSFDYTALNFVGHTLYMVFNVSLFFSTFIESEYLRRHPRGLNPVKLNDVFFSVHASIVACITAVQCLMYERGQQRISYVARSTLGVFFVIVVGSAAYAALDKIHWLDFLLYCSYIKLSITMMKYVPQAILNYRRKSTEGWSIENILLDFTGGSLSMLQMIIDGYNYDDFESIFGDLTKFGLGLFSVLFDSLFIVQHYILYRHGVPYNEIAGESIRNDVDTENDGAAVIETINDPT